MSVESFKVLCQEIEAQLLKLLNHVTCSICQELFHRPVKTPCGHIFCSRCIKKVLSSKGNNGCPLCKCVIKRYCLEDDKAKFTISEICRELPNAFQNDVKDGCRFFEYSENDLLSASNIVQLLFEATPNEIMAEKKKTFFVDFCKENSLQNILFNQSEAKNFVPNLKDSISKKYEITIRKKTGDFILLSGSEIDPDVDIHPSSQCQTKLQNLKENYTDEKIQKHLNTAVNKIHPGNLLSLPPNYSQTNSSHDFSGRVLINGDNTAKEIKVEKSMSVQRGNKKKSTSPTILNVNLKNNIKKICNSYKFVPVHSDLVKNSNLKKEKEESKLHKTQNLAGKGNIINKSVLKHSGKKEKERRKKKRYFINYEAGLGLLTEKNVGFDKSSKKTNVESSIYLKMSHLPSMFSGESCIQTEEHKYHCEFSDEKRSCATKSDTFKSKGNEIQNVEGKDNILLHSFINPTSVTLCKENFLRREEHEFKKKKLKKKDNFKNQMSFDKKESFFNLVNLKTEEALHLEQSVEKCLLSFRKNSNIVERTLNMNSLKKDLKEKKTILLSILEEIVKDDSFYCKQARNVSIRFSKNILQKIGHKEIKGKKDKVCKDSSSIDELSFRETLSNFSQSFSANEFVISHTKEDQLTQKLDLIGFSSTEEITEGSKFLGKIINNMETELESSLKQSLTKSKNFDRTSNNQCNKKADFFSVEKVDLKMLSGNGINKVNEKKKNYNLTLDCFQKIPEAVKSPYINFLLLGRLTPTTRRSKSSVVKLVFPVGFTSFIKKHAISYKFSTGVKSSQTSFQPYKNCIPRYSNSSYSDLTSQVHAAIQASTNVHSATFQSPQIKKVHSEQILQDLNQSKNIEKGPKQLNTSYREENKFYETFRIQTPELNEMRENYLEPFSEKNFKPETKNIQNSSSRTEQVLCETVNSSADFENEVSLELDKKLTEQNILDKNKQKLPIYHFKSLPIYNKLSKLQKCDLLNKETTTPFFKEMKCDDQFSLINFQQNHKNFEENKSNKIEKHNTKYGEFFTQSSLNYQKKGCGNGSPEKFQCTQRAKAFKTEESVTDLLIRKNKKVSKRSHKMIHMDTNKNKRSQAKISKALKNINLDRVIFPNLNEIKTKYGEEKNAGEKSEESDSDFFVEQTPPSLMYSRLEEAKCSSKNEIRKNLFFRTPIKRKAETSQEKLNVNTENLKEEFWKFSNIHSETDLFKEDLNDKITENKFCRTTDNSLCNKNQLCVVASSVKNLGTIKKFAMIFKIEFLEKPSKAMTHLIVGLHENEDGEMLPLCTPKLLFAVANKKWVVSELWAETCIKLNKIVPEENFETYDPVGGFGCRNARLSQDFLLENCEIYLLGNFETIPKDELADLIIDCGGTLISQPEKFSYCALKIRMIIVDRDSKPADEQYLRELYEKHRSVVLSRDVLIMSIQTYSLSNFFPYLMHVSSTDDLVKLGYPIFLVKPEESIWDSTMSEK